MARHLSFPSYGAGFEQAVGRFAEKTAFGWKTAGHYRTLSYGEVGRQVRGVAQGLLGMGLERGTRAAVLSENRPEWFIAYMGIVRAGGIVVPLDAQLSPAEWRTLIEDSECRLTFVSGSLLPGLQEALAGRAAAGAIICLDAPPAGAAAAKTLAQLVEEGLALDPAPALPESTPADIMTIIYTSGTTGRPKGVMLTHGNIVSEISLVLQAIHADERDTLLCLLPLQHVLSSIINVLLPMLLGAQVNFIESLKRTEILEALESGKVTILVTVPQFFYLLHKRIEEELARKAGVARRAFHGLRLLNRFCRRTLHCNPGRLFFRRIHRAFGSRMRLFVSGGSAFDPEIAQVFYDLGFTILQGYGLTETSGACSTTRVDNNVIGSVGPALPGVEIRIVDPDESGVGEIAIRGPMVMKGYYRNPAATAEVLRDGWLYSGDLGRLDERGNLFVTGRKKEVIVLPNGKNIYPDELEAHYGRCPCIREIAVVGVARRGAAEPGEQLHAVIVPDFEYLREKKIANARVVIRDEVARLSNQLPRYKRLMSYQIQAEPLPRTTTRKIKRLELKALLEAGALAQAVPARSGEPQSADDVALLQSPVGQEVLLCLREAHRRKVEIDPGMNLELDLGFDSMERVELLAGLERALNLKLPEDFGVEIHTVRDLIVRLQERVEVAPGLPAAGRSTWSGILSAEALAGDADARIDFAGRWLTIFKYSVLRLIYLLMRVLLRLEVRGRENLPARGPFLICPNHLSFIDPLVVISALPYRLFRHTFFLGYSAIFQKGVMGLLARLAGVIPVDADANLLRAMKIGAWGLRSGRILCIFPEGGRSFDGTLQEFRKGAAILARETGAALVPVRIRGTYEVWPRDSRRIRLHKVTVRFGRPLEPGSGSYEEDTERLRAAVSILK